MRIDEVLCHRTGIVEPITHAMLQHFIRAPQEMVELADAAVRADEAFLVWRLLTVGIEATAIADPERAERARSVEAVCRDYWLAKFKGIGLH
jgi:hypothetical protein